MKYWWKCKQSLDGYCQLEVTKVKFCAGHARCCEHWEGEEPQGFKKHNGLKEKARQHLLELGFAPDEIHAGYKIEIPILFRVDIVGIKPDLKVAVECGDLHDVDRVRALKKIFNQVITMR